MVYQWKTASHINVDAQKAGEVCEQLEKTVGLTAKTLLDASREESAPLHGEFEWNDGKAAELYRESQARHIIACLVISNDAEEEEKATPVRAFFTVEESKYESTYAIISEEEKRQKLLQQALSELIALKKKYASLKELTPVFDVVRSVEEAVG